MKVHVKNFLISLLVFFFTTTIFTGILIPPTDVNIISSLVVFSIAIMLAKPLLDFLTIKINFLTYFLMSSIVLICAVFLLSALMPGFLVDTTYFAGLDLSFVKIAEFEITPIFTNVFFSITSGFILTIFYSLEK